MNKLLLITQVPESQKHKHDMAKFSFNYGILNITCKISVSLQKSFFKRTSHVFKSNTGSS